MELRCASTKLPVNSRRTKLFPTISKIMTQQTRHVALVFRVLGSFSFVAKYWVFIYEPHYDHNDLFFWISSLRTQSKNYINIWN